MSEPKLIINPETGDTNRIEDILEELQQVMKKHGYALVHANNAMVLGIVAGVQLRALAEIRQVTPTMIEWRKISWAPKTNEVKH